MPEPGVKALALAGLLASLASLAHLACIAMGAGVAAPDPAQTYGRARSA